MDLIIVIPCYNEASRFNQAAYQKFLQEQHTTGIVFVDDGSKDNTQAVLAPLAGSFPELVTVVPLDQNVGKAEAVRQGMLFAEKHLKFQKIAFLDADLSTSLEECKTLASEIKEDIVFVFGSRILKIDNQIERKWYRFLIGRIIATVISKLLGVPVYDTQCGCKIFKASLAQELFKTPFISKWLFDVELFYRMINSYGKEKIKQIAKEVPLKKWIDTGDSRVKFTYFFKLWKDLYVIAKTYSKK